MTDEQMKALEVRIEAFLGVTLPNGLERDNDGLLIADRCWDLISSDRSSIDEDSDEDVVNELGVTAEEEFADLANKLSDFTEFNWTVRFPVEPDFGEHYLPGGLIATEEPS